VVSGLEEVEMITIFGKDTCPYTQAAVEDHRRRGVEFEYLNVKKDPVHLDRMLSLSGGQRRVPVILGDDGKVTIGFGGT
jgi:glutaredoxin